MNYPRIPGHRLSNTEIIEFWNDEDGSGIEYILDTACQIAPGVTVQGGNWTGQQLMKLTNGEILGSIPDDSVPDDFGRLTFWGVNLDPDQLGNLLVDFIVDNHLEVFIAFAMNFHEANSAEYAADLVACQRRFWSHWNLIDREQREKLGVELARRSEPYRLTIEFFDNPFEPRFRGLLEQAINEHHLESVYYFAGE